MKKETKKSIKETAVGIATVAGAAALIGGAYHVLPGEDTVARAHRLEKERTFAVDSATADSARVDTRKKVTTTCVDKGANPIRPCRDTAMELYDTVTGEVFTGTGKLTKTDLQYGQDIAKRAAAKYAKEQE